MRCVCVETGGIPIAAVLCVEQGYACHSQHALSRGYPASIEFLLYLVLQIFDGMRVYNEKQQLP